jgi:hypothetical protein
MLAGELKKRDARRIQKQLAATSITSLEQKKRHSDKLAFAVREELEESILGLDIMSDEAGLPASSSQTAIAPIYRPAMEVDHRSVCAECCSSQRRTACS